MKLIFAGLLTLLFVGCAGSIDGIDTSSKNQDCVRQCTGVYSQCIGGTYALSAQNACASGFKACSNTCPAK